MKVLNEALYIKGAIFYTFGGFNYTFPFVTYARQ